MVGVVGKTATRTAAAAVRVGLVELIFLELAERIGRRSDPLAAVRARAARELLIHRGHVVAWVGHRLQWLGW